MNINPITYKGRIRRFVRRPPLLFVIVTIIALLFLSMLLSGLAYKAGAADLNPSAPALRGNVLPVSQELLPTSIAPATQTASTVAGPLSQTPVNPLVPFESPSVNQTAVGSASPSAPIAPGSIPNDEAANATVPDTTSGDVSPSAAAFTTNVTQPAADNGSLAAVPVSHSGGGGGNGLFVLTASSYGAAIIVLALMWYWSLSFGEGAESPPDARSADLAEASGAAYTTLENLDYVRSNHGP